MVVLILITQVYSLLFYPALLDRRFSQSVADYILGIGFIMEERV